jgi:hypothetical protein
MIILFVSCFPVGEADGLEINPVATVLPLVIKNGTMSNVVLDCDYALNDDDYATNEKNPGALVVKWFFNNDPAPVYQWIHSKKPQGLGVLNGKLNLEYRISDDNATMYRALQIINPTTELSGEYKCTVSTFNDERSQTRKMIIYGKSAALRRLYCCDKLSKLHYNLQLKVIVLKRSEFFLRIMCLNGETSSE